ncbi:MAG: YgfZ/GcvT domain-containing protein [Acidimicrobiia bacterium]
MSDDSFGDVTAEYLSLRREAGLVEGEHALTWVRGPEAVAFLDGLLTQHLAPLPPGGTARSLLLGPQGKLRATLWVLRGDGEVGLVSERDRREAVVEDLRRFRIRVEAEIEPEEQPVVELWGPRAVEVLKAADLPVPEGWTADGDLVVIRAPLGPLDRFFLVGVEPRVLVEAGAHRSGALAARAVRVEAGEPLMGRDLDEGTIPHESGLVPQAVSFAKGCFLGYELVERIESRGRARAELRGVEIRENVLPPEGAEVTAGDKVLGRLTSVAESLTLRAPVGLAVVRREVEPGMEVEVRWPGGRARARVRALPMDDFTESPTPPPGGEGQGPGGLGGKADRDRWAVTSFRRPPKRGGRP